MILLGSPDHDELFDGFFASLVSLVPVDDPVLDVLEPSAVSDDDDDDVESEDDSEPDPSSEEPALVEPERESLR